MTMADEQCAYLFCMNRKPFLIYFCQILIKLTTRCLFSEENNTGLPPIRFLFTKYANFQWQKLMSKTIQYSNPEHSISSTTF